MSPSTTFTIEPFSEIHLSKQIYKHTQRETGVLTKGKICKEDLMAIANIMYFVLF